MIDKDDWGIVISGWGTIISCILIVLIALFSIVYAIKHKCIRYENIHTTCQGDAICVSWDSTFQTCSAYMYTSDYKCTLSVCVERQ